jgi:hypothetical protein
MFNWRSAFVCAKKRGHKVSQSLPNLSTFVASNFA